MRLHYLQHVPFEGLGTIKAWVHERGFELTSTRLFDNESLPHLDDIDWLVIMGGPMSIYDEEDHPWLVREKQFIREAIKAGKQVLGICLGGQLVADALGARVRLNAGKEVGWFPIQLTGAAVRHPVLNNLPQEMMAFHWHSDSFMIPEDAQHIAFNEATQNQGFVYGDRVLALQCHLEVTPKIVNSLIERFSHELMPSPQIQMAQAMLANDSYFSDCAKLMYQLLDNLAALKVRGKAVATA